MFVDLSYKRVIRLTQTATPAAGTAREYPPGRYCLGVAGRKSGKTPIIEWLFFNRKYDSATKTLIEPVVTFDDIRDAVVKMKLSTAPNIPNFWKDLTRRGAKGINAHWPQSVFAAGFTGADAIGTKSGACFMFEPVPKGQTTPAVDSVVFSSTLPTRQLQSLSMPQTMKALGRPGENWHAQVADRLNVVSSFFALCSPRNVPPRSVHEVNFLQTGVKMQRGETDAAFSLIADDGNWLVSAEVKGRREEFNLPQIARAAVALEAAAKKSSKLGAVRGVIPVGIKVVGRSKLWVVEFDPVAAAGSPLTKVAEGVFELVPHVPGIE